MLKYTIDDSIEESNLCSIEVTMHFEDQKRWCFFVTPQVLGTNGDLVEGTSVRFHLGVTHMIVVSEINESVIDYILKKLFAEDLLETHTIPLI